MSPAPTPRFAHGPAAPALFGVWGNNNNWGGVGFPQTTSDTAIFTSVVGNSSTPTIYGNYSLLNLTFNSGAAAFTITTNGAGRSLTIVGTTTQNAANVQTISIPLTGASGVMTKAGTGTLVLTAVNTYSGATTINAGKLLGKSGGSISNSVVTVTATTATNAVQIATAGGQWACAGLTFSAAGVLSFDFNNGVAPHATTAPLQVNGDLAFTATPTVIILNNSIPATTASYPLISYTGTASGTAPTAVTITPALTGGATAALRLDGSGKVLYLDVTGGRDADEARLHVGAGHAAAGTGFQCDGAGAGCRRQRGECDQRHNGYVERGVRQRIVERDDLGSHHERPEQRDDLGRDLFRGGHDDVDGLRHGGDDA